MFSYKKNSFGYFILSDKIKGEYGPFDGIFCKNKYLGYYKKKLGLEKRYPSYKFSLGFSKSRVFVIGKEDLEEIFNY